jgi:predicted nucleic acid-binding protein
VTKAFFDTNVLLYTLSGDAEKADRAEALITDGGCISVQVLNEFAAVATRKLSMSWTDVGEALAVFREVCRVESLTVETHDLAREIAARHGFGFYDSLIVASALLAECPVLYSEDLQHGQMIDRALMVKNPFR